MSAALLPILPSRLACLAQDGCCILEAQSLLPMPFSSVGESPSFFPSHLSQFFFYSVTRRGGGDMGCNSLSHSSWMGAFPGRFVRRCASCEEEPLLLAVCH